MPPHRKRASHWWTRHRVYGRLRLPALLLIYFYECPIALPFFPYHRLCFWLSCFLVHFSPFPFWPSYLSSCARRVSWYTGESHLELYSLSFYPLFFIFLLTFHLFQLLPSNHRLSVAKIDHKYSIIMSEKLQIKEMMLILHKLRWEMFFIIYIALLSNSFRHYQHNHLFNICIIEQISLVIDLQNRN